ncbi:MAG: TonB-dependent receptor [Gammaproteobacteria bacterium]|nr:TonB-dependent receptor [Gammaproteobacteria bacterium]
MKPVVSLCLAAVAASLLSTLSVRAAESSVVSTEADVIEEVRVVGARLPRPMSEVVGTVDIITRDALLDGMATRISDVVRYTPGVSVSSADSRFGESEFTVRGLSGNRVVQLIDGIRVAPQFDVGAFANAGQDYFVPDAISRVEILRGPASSLFGSDALGGVVAVLTRDPAEFLGTRSSAYSASSTYSGADDAVVVSVSAAVGGERTSAVLHASRLSGHELDHSAAGPSDGLDRRRESALIKLDHVLPSGNRLRLRADGFEEAVDTDLMAVLGYGSRYRNTTYLAGDDARRRHSVSLGYEFTDSGFVDEGRVVLYQGGTDVSQTTHERRDLLLVPLGIERTFDYEHRHTGLVADGESVVSGRRTEQRIGFGFAIDASDLEERRGGTQTNLATGGSTNVILGEVMPVRDFPDTELLEIGAMCTTKISFGRWALVPALRIDAYRLNAHADQIYREDNPAALAVDVDEVEFSPKLGVRFALSERTTAFAQYSHGFRAPPFEDVNIGLDIPQFNIRAIPNPDLRAESSDGLELGLRHVGERMRGSVALFGANYDNFIETKVNLGPDPDTGVVIFQSRNIDEARVYGAEATVEIDLSPWLDGLTFGLAANWTRGENRADNEPLNSVDPLEAVARVSWAANDHVRLQWITTAVASQDRVDESTIDLFETAGFATSDLLASFQLDVAGLRDVRMDIGVFNVFDKTYWRWASVRNRAEGDPLTETMSAPGRYGSVSLHVAL